MELLISRGWHTSDGLYMNAAPIYQKRHDQREKIRWWWKYSKPKKKQRGLLHQGHSKIINSAMAPIKDHERCLALISTLRYFYQVLVGVHERQWVEKEAANFMLSWGDHHETRKEQHHHLQADGSSQMALYGTRNM